MANQQNSVEISEEKKEILEKYHLKFNDDLIGNKFRIKLIQDMKNFIDRLGRHRHRSVLLRCP